MEEENMYLINEVAEIAGITTRTLRHYDNIGLLKPNINPDSGYRLYDDAHIDRLQQILVYKKLGISLSEIKQILDHEDYQMIDALKQHIKKLTQESRRLNMLIDTMKNMIDYKEGIKEMNNQEKFKGLKAKDIFENEEKYGQELREKYGDEKIEQSNHRYKKLSKYQYQLADDLAKEILEKLKIALSFGDPRSEIAQEVCQLHQQWIQIYWPKYDKKSHLSLVDMYLGDDRFKAYYEKVGKGATQLLNDAMHIYLK
jgi:DNA-binding transcriptional MerR regulator